MARTILAEIYPDIESHLGVGRGHNVRKSILAALAMALLVLSGVSQGCGGSGKWTVTTAADGQGAVSPAGITEWDDGAEVPVTATPTPFWRFDSWSGDASGAENPLIFDIERNMTFVAHFIPNTKSDKLIDETIGMAPAEPYSYGHNAHVVMFYVAAATMHDVTVSGTFNVTSTSPGDEVEVLVLDRANNEALYVGGNWTALYSSGQVAAGTVVNVLITTAGQSATPFYLVFVGISPEGPSVYVQANFDLKYTAYN